MVNIRNMARSLKDQPGYAAMRGLARFPLARQIATSLAGTLSGRNFQIYISEAERKMSETVFPDLDRRQFLRDLSDNGLAFGLKLPPKMVEDIRAYADRADVYADRDPSLGFKYDDRKSAEDTLKKPILLAQYYNTMRECEAIRKLATDPALEWIAAHYLGAVPAFFGSNLWWTFPVEASEEDRDRHAHVFHRDVDDFRFLKFFFYITDVPEGEGAHVCVSASNINPPISRTGDRWNIRRYSDEEVHAFYPAEEIKEICGPAGTGFAEDTLCIHKGSTPKNEARLLLQLQFGLFDYHTMSDARDKSVLKRL